MNAEAPMLAGVMASEGAPREELRVAKSCRDELMRQLLLERRHSVVVAAPREGQPPAIPKGVLRALDGFEFSAQSFPDLAALEGDVDRVLVRADGMVFNVALLTVAGKKGAACTRLSVNLLIDIGTRFTAYTGSVGANRMPVTFQLFEFFPGAIPSDFPARAAEFKRRGISTPKIGIGVVALDCKSGRTWSNFPGLAAYSHTALARRAFRERDLSPERRRELLARSGFQPGNAALGTAAGTTLGLAGTWGLLQANAQNGKLYGAAVVLASMAAAVISLRACRVVHPTIPQTTVAGALSALAIIAVGHAWGLELGFGTAITLGASVLISAMIGAVDNPQGSSGPANLR